MKKLFIALIIALFINTSAVASEPATGTATLWADLPLAGKLFYGVPPVLFMAIIPLSQGKTFERYAQLDCTTASKDEGRGICSHIGPTNCYAGDNWYTDACAHFR